MADYIATTEQLTATADAIRAKTGEIVSITWDADTGFADDIIDISIDTSDANATAGDIRYGKTAYVQDTKITGNIVERTSSDLTASGATVTIPAGIYDSQTTKSIVNGSVTTPATTITKNPTISINSSTGLITASISGTQNITPTVSTGYVSSGTAGTITVNGSTTSQLSTQAAVTITPGTSNKTAVAAGKYTTGAVTIAGSANLVAANIKKSVNIFGVTGTYEGSPPYAIISVTYPSGSTCTCTKGSTTLTAAGTSGKYNFLVPESGSWVVSCIKGTDSNSQTVNITTQYQIISIELKYTDSVLNNNTWAVISAVAQAGTGDTYWDIGDCKAVTLNGKIGNYLTLSNTTLYVYILDFNHPINKTTADNNIIWGGFKTALNNGVDVALCDSGCNSFKSSGKYFNLNHVGYSSSPWNTNYGGWKGCDFRYDILGGTSTAPSPYNTYKTTSTTGYDATQDTIDNPVADTLMAALPSDLRAALRLWNRYVDYKGNSSNTDANCSTATVDALSLLAEFEIFGSRTYANQYEKNHQKQMAYFSAGNSKIKYKHNATSTACSWYEASVHYSGADAFCSVYTNGNADYYISRFSHGLAPAFKV